MLKIKYPNFYTNPEMVGHSIAKKSFDLALEIKKKYVKTKNQKNLYNSIINLNNDSWHYWYNLDNKYLCQLRYTIRHIEKSSPTNLYCHIVYSHSMLKSDLLRWLEVYAYTYDNSNFLKVYSQDFLMLGMDKTDSKNRCDNYIRDLKIKYNYQV